MKRLLFATAILLIAAVNTFAQNAAEVKQRMVDRLPTIIEMKTNLLIGENNKAYLSVLKDVSPAQAAIVKDENADRLFVYTHLAQQTGASLDLVLAKRAAQLREQAASGTMIQTESGSWIQKK
jgi:uncharacterized protein YdbL (DUF1318 family)